MSQEIQPYQDQLPGAPAEPMVGAAPAGPHRSPVLRLLSSAKRHWLMVLLVWVFVGGPGAAAVWFLIAPTYTASAHIEVAPTVPSILYEDDETRTLSGFDGYLNTQAAQITSNAVLTAALADPTLKGLPPLDQPDPTAALREAVTAKTLSRTHLVRVSVEDKDPDVAKRITRAIMLAYKALAIGNEEKEWDNKRTILEQERARLRKEVEGYQDDILKLAEQDGTATESTFELLRESIAELSVQTRGELERAELEESRLTSQLAQLDQGVLPTTMPAEEIIWKQEQVENDLMVGSIRAELAGVTGRLVRLGPAERDTQKKKALEAELEKELARAAADADHRLEERRRGILALKKSQLQAELATATTRVKMLRQRVLDQHDEGLRLGRRGLEIKRLQEKSVFAQQDFARVDEKLRQMDIEKGRPARIRVEETAEILPDGINNRRVKLVPVAILGALGLAFGLAFLRDLLEARVNTVEDVEAGAGLRLLGTLPSVDDLRRGRVTEDDFRESYRLMRATIAGASAGGRIPKSLVVTSAQASEGKTSLAVSLAAALAETGVRVLVVDGDVQAPRIGQVLRMSLPFGLRQVLLGEQALADSVGRTPVSGLDVLVSGRNGGSAAGILTSRLAVRLLEAAADRYDHVVIDSPPALGAADALIWAQAVDGVILSSLAGHSDLRTTRQACRRVVAVGGRMLGAVICNVSVRDTYYSSHSYRASRYTSNGDAAGSDEPAAPPPNHAPCIQLAGKVHTEPLKPEELHDSEDAQDPDRG